MKNREQYATNLFSVFRDRELEREFVRQDIRYTTKCVGPAALVFGVVFALFSISDCYSVNNPSALGMILSLRFLFLAASIAFFFLIRRIGDHSHPDILITAYEILGILSFLLILYQYDSLGLMACFSFMAITLALYFVPNRLFLTQIIAVVFSLLFFILFSSRSDIGSLQLYVIIAYDLIFHIFGNLAAYMTNIYRRRQFADSRDLLQLYLTDSLTGISNRTKLDQELEKWVCYNNRYGAPLSLILFDIDDFKKINDSCGHLFGDKILQNIADVIAGAIRSTDIFARWGGDEFVILLPNTDIFEALKLTERLRNRIRKHPFERVGNLTCSYGLVTLKPGEDAAALLLRADKLLYDAKGYGKNIIACVKTGICVEFVS